MVAAWAGCTKKLQVLCDGDDAVELRISGGVDFSHPVRAERRGDFLRAEAIARGTLRAILRKTRLWASIQPDVRMLRVHEEVGRDISRDEEGALLNACRASRSRSLYPAVLIALNTCMRYSELRLLR
jgi:hypothetical protein